MVVNDDAARLGITSRGQHRALVAARDDARLRHHAVRSDGGNEADLVAAGIADLGAYARSDKAQIKSNWDEVYEMFPRLEERKNQAAGTLSGGEQQMLAIARALIKNARGPTPGNSISTS